MRTKWDHFVLGVVVAGFVFLMFANIYSIGPPASIDHTDGCVIITEYGTVLTDPVPGEDDGAIYCPTGEYSSSQLGRITR